MEHVDALKLDSFSIFRSDVCIIGGGAAGIAIAREFVGTKYSILLLESGGFSYDDETQSLYDFENIGHSLRAQKGYISRNRYLGGSTNTWHGGCAPLNSIDFEKREWVPESGWPIQKSDLDQYYRKASQVFRLPKFENFNLPIWRQFILQDYSKFLDGEILCPEPLLLANRPINMRSEYADQLKNTPNIQICINANVTELESNAAQNAVEKLHVSSLNGNHFHVHAKHYILACGGWENARLLLLSRRHSASGLGNQYDNVGRYYAEHPKIMLGNIVPTTKTLRSPVLFWKRRLSNDGFVRLGIRLSDSVQRKEKLLNHYIQLMYPHSMSEAIASSDDLLKNLGLSRSTIHKLVKFAPHAFRLLDAFERRILNLPLRFKQIAIFNHFEQIPNRESRVTLSNQRDALGMNLLKVDLKVSTEEKHCMVRFQKILGSVFKEQCIGNLTSSFPPIETEWPGLTDSSHHIGTTRMSVNARKGVVNENCQVHGIHNLFIAGSAVFPTGGHINPTLTIVALSLRLADFLKHAVLAKGL